MDPSDLDLRALTLSPIEQASFRYAVAAALSDHTPLLREVRVEAERRGDHDAGDCALEVTLTSGEVLSVFCSHDDLFDALEIGLQALGRELRSAERRQGAAAQGLARVA